MTSIAVTGLQAPEGRAMATGQIRRATALVRAVLRAADPERISPAAAAEMAALLGALEKLSAAAAVRYAQRSGKDAAGLLATVSGTARGAARKRLGLAAQLGGVPACHDAFVNGELSIDQAAAIAPLAAVSPAAADDLVRTARTSSVKELRAEAARALHRERGEHEALERARRLHARRYCRTSVTEGGGVRLEALMAPLDGATILAALDRETDAVWKRCADAGRVESRDHCRADALVLLLSGKSTPATVRARDRQHAPVAADRTDRRPVSGTADVLVRVDAAALVRGEVRDGERCEIAGIGPVPVEHARQLIGEGFFTLLVQDGADIRTVTSTTRAVPTRVLKALMLRDPNCVVPRCGATEHLEIDHWQIDFARGGRTQLDNLCRLCALHHRMKTRTGWRLMGGPGHWRWLPPRRAGPLHG